MCLSIVLFIYYIQHLCHNFEQIAHLYLNRLVNFLLNRLYLTGFIIYFVIDFSNNGIRINFTSV